MDNHIIRMVISTTMVLMPRHCKKQVKMMKNRGIKILSYFVAEYAYDRDRDSFKSMYGGDASFIKPTNMMEVAKTMNAMFLQK